MVGHGVGKPGTDVDEPEHVDEELGELVGARRQRPRVGRQSRVPVVLSDHRLLMTHGAHARPARCDHDVVALERAHVVGDDGKGVGEVARVDVHLPAADLRPGHDHLVTEAFEQAHRRPADRREQPVDQAGGEQRDAHVSPSARSA